MPCPAAANHQHATLLAHLGKLDAAKSELKMAEQLTPGAPDVMAARYLIAARAGDLATQKQARAWLDNYYEKVEPASARSKSLLKLYASHAQK
ncbi:MAG: hypothetical protein ACREPB_03570 [Arenimonas sp.]